MNYRRVVDNLPARILPGVPGAAPLKPYVINEASEGDYEIQMYGEIVETRPYDYWRDQPEDGLFIVLNEFLADLDKVKDAKSVTVRINSIGGDLQASIAIYNKLKALNNVTTIVDGLAASGASVIMQAGKTRMIYKNSEVMVHSASVMLLDYYNLSELQDVEKQLEAANEQVIETYVERTGKDRVKIKHMVEDTTWMTGQEIIDNGFADELIDQSIPMSMSADKHFLLCNGLKIDSRVFGKALPAIKATDNAGEDPAPQPMKEVKNKKMTLDELRTQEPDLVKQIEDAAKATVDKNSIEKKAREEERQRIKDIESIEPSIADKDLVNEAKYGDKPMDAKDLAFVAMQKQAALGVTVLGNMQKDSEESGTKNVETLPVDGIEKKNNAEAKKEKDKADIEAAAAALGFRKETK